MKGKVNVQFPCGYKYNLEVSAGFMGFGSMKANDELPDKCPLHGKECPPKKRA